VQLRNWLTTGVKGNAARLKVLSLWCRRQRLTSKTNGNEKAYAEFSNPKGGFVKGDIYIVVFDKLVRRAVSQAAKAGQAVSFQKGLKQAFFKGEKLLPPRPVFSRKLDHPILACLVCSIRTVEFLFAFFNGIRFASVFAAGDNQPPGKASAGKRHHMHSVLVRLISPIEAHHRLLLFFRIVSRPYHDYFTAIYKHI
jgi:hypothetical protein